MSSPNEIPNNDKRVFFEPPVDAETNDRPRSEDDRLVVDGMVTKERSGSAPIDAAAAGPTLRHLAASQRGRQVQKLLDAQMRRHFRDVASEPPVSQTMMAAGAHVAKKNLEDLRSAEQARIDQARRDRFPSPERADELVALAERKHEEAEQLLAAKSAAMEEARGAVENKTEEINAARVVVVGLKLDAEAARKRVDEELRAGAIPTVDVETVEKRIALEKRRSDLLAEDLEPLERAFDGAVIEVRSATSAVRKAWAELEKAKVDADASVAIPQVTELLRPLRASLDKLPSEAQREARRRIDRALREVL
jgi:hypothetical protein